MALHWSSVPLQKIEASSYTVPTASPESDGTYAWNSTTLVLVRAEAGGKTGIGYTYADRATAELIMHSFAPLLAGRDALSTGARWKDMLDAVRNLGRAGICSMAISAVDSALWDLKGRLLGQPLVRLLGQVHESMAIYGSGGFTSYSIPQLQEQLSGWVKQGIERVKMKVGREPAEDEKRVAAARAAIGKGAQLFVDANGAYTRKEALDMAQRFAALDVRWFEEPVSSDDLAGLRLMRDAGPPGMAIAAGEYGYDPFYFRRMLEAGAVDVLQVDATRCGGVTGFMLAAAVCDAFGLPLSSHCAPALHLPLCCCAARAVHMEYFFDHSRIEQMLFDGAVPVVQGRLAPDHSRAGLGLDFREQDAKCYRN